MWRLWWAFLATPLTISPGLAQDPPKKDPPPAKADDKPKTPADEFAAIAKEMQEKESAALKRFREAKDPQEKKKIRDEFFTLKEAGQNKLFELAKKHPREEAAFAAISFAAARGNAQAIDLVLQHHLENKNIGMLCVQLSMDGNAQANKLIRAVLEKAKNQETRGTATLALAMSLKNQADASEDEKLVPQLQADSEKLFVTIEKDFAALKTPLGVAGEVAKKSLFELRNLSVGRTAPDLTGEDLEGKAIKLSDYRGKVIFLDFWAHW